MEAESTVPWRDEIHEYPAGHFRYAAEKNAELMKILSRGGLKISSNVEEVADHDY